MKHKIVSLRLPEEIFLKPGTTLPGSVPNLPVVTGNLAPDLKASYRVDRVPPVVNTEHVPTSVKAVANGLYRPAIDAGSPTLVVFGGLSLSAMDTLECYSTSFGRLGSNNYGVFAPLAPQELGWFEGSETSMKAYLDYCYESLKGTLPKGADIILSGYCFGTYAALYFKQLVEKDNYFQLKHTYLQNPIISYKKSVKTKLQKMAPNGWRFVYGGVKRQLRDLDSTYDVRRLFSNRSQIKEITVVTAEGDRVNYPKYQKRLASFLNAEHLVVPGDHSSGNSIVLEKIVGHSIPISLAVGEVKLPKLEMVVGKSIPDETGLFLVGLENRDVQNVLFESLRRLPVEDRKALAGAYHLFDLENGANHSISGFYINTDGCVEIISCREANQSSVISREGVFQAFIEHKKLKPSLLVYDSSTHSFQKSSKKTL